MLDKMRGAAKSWVAKILIGLLVVSFGIFWGIQDVFRGYQSDALANVGDQKITAQEFSNRLQDAIQNYAQRTGQSITPDIAREIGLDRQVLSDLMRAAALDAETGKLKLAVSDAQLVAIIAKEPAFQGADGKFDPEVFRGVLRRNNISEQQYLASERQRFLRTSISDSAAENFVAPAILVEAAYRHRNEERDARFFVVKALETDVPAPSDDDIKKFYDERPQDYTAPEYRNIVIIKADPADVAATVAIDESALQAGYDKYKPDYFTPESRVIEQIIFPTLDEAQKAKARIAAGEDFLAIAKERGLDPTTINLGDQRKDDIPDSILADAAFALSEGAVSDPVQGKLSIVLLRVTKISPEHQRTLDEVKPELTTRLQNERAREEILNLYNSIEDARAAQTSFEEIAKKAGIPIVTVAAVDSRGLDKDGKSVDLPHKDEVLQAVFASDVGVENDALQSDEAYIWYEVREVTPSALRPLDQIKDKVKADWSARKLQDIVLEKARKLAERGTGGTTLDSLATEANATVQEVRALKRNETTAEFDAAAISAVFGVPENGFTSALEADGKGAKVIQSQPVLSTQLDAASDEAKALRETLSQGASTDLSGMLLTGLQDEFGWSIDEGLWQRITGTSTP
jgi:peptidyl-prolyl cis-trans isomerase D